MTPSGRLQLLIWQLRLQLSRLSALRHLVRYAQSLRPGTRDQHLQDELGFWKRWMTTQGLSSPEDYRARFDPAAPVQEYLAPLIDAVPRRQVEILDVGAGPVTLVGRIHPGKELSVTATDVLASHYEALLAEFGIKPPVPTIYAEAEKLREQLGERQFDIVHACNSLDHCADPFAALDEMVAVTRDGGHMVLFHEENEGSNELYHGLHKWDFTCQDSHFIIAGPGPGGPRRDVTALLSDRVSTKCTVESGLILVVMHKPERARAMQ